MTSPFNASSEYIAPYEPLPDGVEDGNRCFIYLNDGHNVEKHFEYLGPQLQIEPQDYKAIGKAIKVKSSQYTGYSALLSNEHIETVRRDPGVQKVIQSTDKMVSASERALRQPVFFKYAGRESGPGWIVGFWEDCTLEEHFAKIGERITVKSCRDSNEPVFVYFPVDLTDSQMRAVFSDPNVESVGENCYCPWFSYEVI